MKFEFVEFYPVKAKESKKTRKRILGSVHIYAIDCKLDIRGINVLEKGKQVFFYFPHFLGVDDETGEKVRYPFIRWTDNKTHESMINFLHQEVKPIIKRILNGQGAHKNENTANEACKQK